MPFYDQKKIQALLNRLDQMSPVELTAHEPVFMFLLTSLFIHKQYAL